MFKKGGAIFLSYAIMELRGAHLPLPCYETRVRKPGMVDAQVSTWCANTEASCGGAGKMFDFVFTATMMWNPDKEIVRIVCRHAGNTDAEILLFEVKV